MNYQAVLQQIEERRTTISDILIEISKLKIEAQEAIETETQITKNRLKWLKTWTKEFSKI